MLDEARALQLLYKTLNEIAKEWEGKKEEWDFFLEEVVGMTAEEKDELEERGLLPYVNAK